MARRIERETLRDRMHRHVAGRQHWQAAGLPSEPGTDPDARA